MLSLVEKEISDSEEIVRVLLNPIHINKNAIVPYALQPPANSQDISVNRLSLTTHDICKKQGIKMQNLKNTFYGLGVVMAEEIRKVGFEVVYSPIKNDPHYEDNPAHADIKIGEIKIKETPLTTETTLKIKKLLAKINILLDPNPDTDSWD